MRAASFLAGVEEVALEIQTRCDIDGEDVPESIRDFVGSVTGSDRRHERLGVRFRI
jgi:hypothetical protein